MGILVNKNALTQAIHQNAVEPVNRLQLLPDQGIAVRAHTTLRTSGNQRQPQDFWTALASTVRDIGQWLLSNGMKSNDIIVDLYCRTPTGVFRFANVQLNQDQIGNSLTSDLTNWLNKGGALAVRVTFDGGRPTSITPISWIKLTHSIESTLAQVPAGAQTGDPISLGDNAQVVQGSLSSSSINVDGHNEIKQYETYIAQAASEFKVDPCLVGAVIIAESGGRKGLTSHTGAQGLMQMEPGTFKEVYGQIGKKYNLPKDAFDTRAGIFCGTKYLRTQLERFNFDPRKTVASYNAGPGAVEKYNDVPPFPETQNYVVKVLGLWHELQGVTQINTSNRMSNRAENQHQDSTTATSSSGIATANGAV